MIENVLEGISIVRNGRKQSKQMAALASLLQIYSLLMSQSGDTLEKLYWQTMLPKNIVWFLLFFGCNLLKYKRFLKYSNLSVLHCLQLKPLALGLAYGQFEYWLA